MRDSTTGAALELEGWRSEDPRALLGWVWGQLSRATADARHAWRSPTLATGGAQGPSARVVVLREVSQSAREVVFHTDARSQKIAAIADDARVCWACYDARRRVQVRLWALARIHTPDDARGAEAWEALSASARRAYAVQPPPGAAIAAPELIAYEDEVARASFRVVVTTVTRVEVLVLAQPDHRRARFDWSDEVAWAGGWVAP